MLYGHLAWCSGGALAQGAHHTSKSVSHRLNGASMAFVYGTVRGVRSVAAVLLLRDLWRILTGQLSEADLVNDQGTEEKP